MTDAVSDRRSVRALSGSPIPAAAALDVAQLVINSADNYSSSAASDETAIGPN